MVVDNKENLHYNVDDKSLNNEKEKNKKIYGLRYDLIFKNVFGCKNLLRQFFREIFEEEIGDFTYGDKETFKENKQLSYSICDLLLEKENETIIFEIQNQDLDNIEARMTSYMMRFYNKQEINNNYTNLKPLKIRLIFNYPYGKKGSLKEYKAFEKRLDEKFGNFFDIKIWNIQEALKEVGTIGYEFALIFTLDEQEKEDARKILKELNKKEMFKGYIYKVGKYNVDKKTYEKLQRREMKQMNLNDVARNNRNRGIEIGRKEGIHIGSEEKQLEIAKNLLLERMSPDFVIKVTGLNEEQITNMILEISNNKKLVKVR